MNENIKLFEFDNTDELVIEFADKIAHNLQKAVNENGQASLLVSGGSTPQPLFARLSNLEIDWNKIKIGLVDERWVEFVSNDSNARLVSENLIQNKASKAKFVGMKLSLDSPKQAEKECGEIYANELWPFDVVILGMGNDAHTASLFPKTKELQNAMTTDDICVATMPLDAQHERMSLSLKAILSAKNLYLHFEGEAKKEVFRQVISGADYNEMPIRAVVKQNQKEVEVYFA